MDSKVNVPLNFYQIVKWASIFIIIASMKAARPIVLPLLLALFISITLSLPISYLVDKKINRTFSTIIILLVFVSSVYLIGDVIAKNIESFASNLPEYKVMLANKLDGTQVGDLISAEFKNNNDKSKIMSLIFKAIGATQKIIGQVVFIIILTLFMIFELELFPLKFNAIFGPTGSIGAKANLELITKNITRYLGIKTISSVATGLLIYIFLKIIGVDYAILWALIAFLFNYIPNIGSMIAAIPALVFVLATMDYNSFFLAGMTFLFVNMIIGSFIEPKILGKGMGLSTFIVFLSLMFWGWLLGPVGFFLSIPLTMVLKIIVASNPASSYFAILLGTKEDSLNAINKEKEEMG